jgi:hypothetical protein
MEYVKLGRTGLDVSVCLGCMSYGGGNRGNHAWSLSEEESKPFRPNSGSPSTCSTVSEDKETPRSRTPFATIGERLDCYLFIGTSNGSYVQKVHFLKQNDKWTWASRFTKYGPKEFTREFLGVGFPEDHEW